MTEMSYEEKVADAKTRIREIQANEAVEMRSKDPAVVYLDVREPHEWNLFHVPGAVHLPLASLQNKVAEVVARESRVVIYCARGNRSALAADSMQELGYTDVVSLAQGIRGWVDAGGDVET
ncbi:MAG: rhodanese-like domain-containing protein [Gemmatimonadaceae bacterium]